MLLIKKQRKKERKKSPENNTPSTGGIVHQLAVQGAVGSQLIHQSN